MNLTNLRIRMIAASEVAGNCFASPELLSHLKGKALHVMCTLHKNRAAKCSPIHEKILKKQSRGSFNYKGDRDPNLLHCEY